MINLPNDNLSHLSFKIQNWTIYESDNGIVTSHVDMGLLKAK